MLYGKTISQKTLSIVDAQAFLRQSTGCTFESDQAAQDWLKKQAGHLLGTCIIGDARFNIPSFGYWELVLHYTTPTPITIIPQMINDNYCFVVHSPKGIRFFTPGKESRPGCKYPTPDVLQQLTHPKAQNTFIPPPQNLFILDSDPQPLKSIQAAYRPTHALTFADGPEAQRWLIQHMGKYVDQTFETKTEFSFWLGNWEFLLHKKKPTSILVKQTIVNGVFMVLTADQESDTIRVYIPGKSKHPLYTSISSMNPQHMLRHIADLYKQGSFHPRKYRTASQSA